ncbi:MAG: class I SAM-dependent methyltransferase [Candidatus Pacearchaeota archaeon]
MKSKKKIKEELANQYFGKEAEEYDYVREKDPRRKAVIEIQKEITSSFLKDTGKKNILDVACGTGRFFGLYTPREIYGIDISPDMLKQARKKKGVKKIVIADAEKIPFPNNMFDVVITSQFIMHTPFYMKVIKEMVRVAKKGGSIIIDFPNKYSLSYLSTKIRLLKGKLRYYNLFTKKQILKIAKDNNLEIKQIRGTVIFSPMFLPKSFTKLSIKLNSFLLKLFPELSYVYYVHFIKK